MTPIHRRVSKDLTVTAVWSLSMNNNKWNAIKEGDKMADVRPGNHEKEGAQKPGQPQHPKQETGKKPEQQKPGKEKEHDKNGGCCGCCGHCK